MAAGDPVKIKHIHTYRRPGLDDILLGWITRDSDVDGLFQWNGTGWTLLQELLGTDLVYDSVSWLHKVFWCDGKNNIWCLDAYTDIICEVTQGPVVQYLIVFQDRLVGAGDARTKAELEAATLVWPADSNRDRVLWCEVLDFENWSPNNFIDAQTGTGELISGLGVNSITSSERGAQGQLVVFKPTSILINDGVLGSGDQRLNEVSDVVGCPGYHSVINTPFGLMFASREGVYMMDVSGREPTAVGFAISPDIAATKDSFDLQRWQAAIYHNYTYKLAIPADLDATINNREWWLDLRPQIFPQEHLWYGPHTGDNILQYEIYKGDLVGAQMNTTLMWKLDVEGVYGSMSDPNTPRVSTMTWPRLASENMSRGKLDAYGFTGVIDSADPVAFTESVDYERGRAITNETLTVPARPAIYNVTRPIKRNSYDAQVSISHSANSDIEVHSVYVRGRITRRQSEKEDGSTQS
jgi:hypothetical protein